MGTLKLISQALSTILHPFVVIPITLTLLLGKFNLISAENRFWGLLLLGFVILPVAIALLAGRRAGTYQDWEVHDQSRRFRLFRIGACSLVALLVLVHALAAPPIFRAASLAGTVALLAAWQINRVTKISLHSLIIAAAGTALLLSGFSTATNLISLSLIILLAGARVILGAHTIGQVGLGLLVGVVTVGLAFLIYG
jgi:hypothetical protein